MKMMTATVTLLALAAPVVAQGQLPAGWQGRVDRANQNIAEVRTMSMASGLHVITGPHVILWQPARTASGSYRASATFAQARAPERMEGYGLFVGGKNLNADNQDYLYFLIRHDGSYMVRHRAGSEIHTMKEWTTHTAIAKPGTSGARNTLAIESLPNEARFLINNEVVFTIPRVPMLGTDGIVGLRVGHFLDVVVSDLTVTPVSK